MPTADIVELRHTVQGMEDRLRANDSTVVQELMANYEHLKPRFANDLQDERDVLLSCGGALMLISQVAGRALN